MKISAVRLVIALSVVLSFTSCKKEDEKVCWECESKRYSMVSGPTTIKTTQCDKTESDIRVYEKDNTFEQYGTTNYLKVETTCMKK